MIPIWARRKRKAPYPVLGILSHLPAVSTRLKKKKNRTRHNSFREVLARHTESSTLGESLPQLPRS